MCIFMYMRQLIGQKGEMRQAYSAKDEKLKKQKE